jgi:methylated-DNA-[protein]-cysteine S-methyltransferase
MDTCIINSPLRFTKISVDINGIVSVTIVNTKKLLEAVLECVTQLKAYFKEEHKTFNLKLNPERTRFQKSLETTRNDHLW